MSEKLILGLGVGLLFGFVLQRGRFCMYTAFRDILLIRDFTLVKAYLLALTIQMVLVHLFNELGLLSFSVPSFFWLSAMVGGFVFGLGMTLAGGCSSSSYYRVGEGMVGSFVVVLMFIISAAATSGGIFRPLAERLSSVRVDMGENEATIYYLLGLNPWLLMFLLLLPLTVWLYRSKSNPPQRGWPWKKTGIILGLVAALAWLASAWSGDFHYGLRMTGPSASLLFYLANGDSTHLNWGVFEIIGIPLGAFFAARWSHEFQWRAPKPHRLMQQAVGGAIMGVGAVIAGGCNIGNSLTGLGILSLTSLVATIFLVLGTWSGTYLFFVRRPVS
ncbi:MAG: YeeE/YedE family protein [Candidatus Binatia bacterium]